MYFISGNVYSQQLVAYMSAGWKEQMVSKDGTETMKFSLAGHQNHQLQVLYKRSKVHLIH